MIMEEKGILYLVATPIGNLGDMTERATKTLEEVDLIAAEDTRNSIKLLNHFGIKTPMSSYHEYNKYDKADELIAKLRRGATIALVTDAGTPAISDPGEVIAAKCIEQGIRVTSLPGACALITALTMSGMSATVPHTGMPLTRMRRFIGSSSTKATGTPKLARFCWQMRTA